MRFRRSISLYDEDQAHRELLIYLEGISGQSRQNQALLQMCLIGFRVMAFQEGGEQAYLSVRNPDLLNFGGKQRKPMVRLPARQETPGRTYSQNGTEAPGNEPSREVYRESPPEPALTPGINDVIPNDAHTLQSPLESVQEADEPHPVNSASELPVAPLGDLVDEPAFELDEEFDTLKLMRQLGGE